ncbi:MAG: hypothetical protein QOE61_4505 [Micromonosporaceae bacterium]|jgi:hypothetical protein|nr:hypothetical protein [Micromonosporaceae bacterium]
MGATAGDYYSSDPWQSLAHRSQPMIAQGIIGGVIGAVGIVMVLVIPPAGHMIVTLAWILVGFLEFVALLSVGIGVLGRVMWKRRKAVLHSQPPADIAGKSPAIDTSPPAE